MKTRNILLGAAVAAALTFAPLSAATAAPTAAVASHSVVAAKAKAFANCTALSKVYKGGVAKAGVKYNKVSGKNKAFKIKPKSSTALYNANKKMDRDKDGVACEK
jgi:hypothetical protein